MAPRVPGLPPAARVLPQAGRRRRAGTRSGGAPRRDDRRVGLIEGHPARGEDRRPSRSSSGSPGPRSRWSRPGKYPVPAPRERRVPRRRRRWRSCRSRSRRRRRRRPHDRPAARQRDDPHAGSGASARASIACADGKVESLDETPPAKRVIDLKGKTVVPGVHRRPRPPARGRAAQARGRPDGRDGLRRADPPRCRAGGADAGRAVDHGVRLRTGRASAPCGAVGRDARPSGLARPQGRAIPGWPTRGPWRWPERAPPDGVFLEDGQSMIAGPDPGALARGRLPGRPARRHAVRDHRRPRRDGRRGLPAAAPVARGRPLAAAPRPRDVLARESRPASIEFMRSTPAGVGPACRSARSSCSWTGRWDRRRPGCWSRTPGGLRRRGSPRAEPGGRRADRPGRARDGLAALRPRDRRPRQPRAARPSSSG